ncbi:subtilisin family serine protease [Streptomyces sp. V4I23]|uniref:S8 family peptidase n=1 Tax=Streptomyces sp. V4I23 TaxID=3042282 RepID=UPI00277DFF43|nr:S8 family peptidase [Streptomyces sp. V4I23]MDQ1008113.1 subtilisin family serine protease [Streptomyces sp. V4I23]
MSTRTRLRALATAVTAAAAVLLAAGPPTAADPSDPSPSHSSTARTPAPLIRSANALPGRYIVTLGDTADATDMMGTVGAKALYTYSAAMRGFAANLSAAQLEKVRLTPGVVSVEEDAKVTAFGASGAGTGAPASSWGLDRIDQRALPLDSDFTAAGDGKGVTAYILDTGIDYGHTEFGGRARFGYDAIGDGRRGQDCQGHGTHVAGIVGGATHGVARDASLVSVRVLDCTGSGAWSGVIAGFDWVAANAEKPAVLNASLGGVRSTAVNNAAEALAESGVLPVVAAGNDAQDACNVSPASADDVVTVGATDRSDRETHFSNYGECLELYAPGASIVSARMGGGSIAHDGTSMASPHVAGVAALYLAEHSTASPGKVADWLKGTSTTNVVTGTTAGSPSRLLYTGGL